MRILRTLAVLSTVSLIAATSGGCLIAAAAAGTGATVAYVRGDTEAVVSATPEQVTAAANAAAGEMKLTVISSHASSIDGKLLARTASDAKIVVTAKTLGEQSSKVTVRVGNFGDDALQAQILEKIRANLPTAQASTPTTQPVAGATD